MNFIAKMRGRLAERRVRKEQFHQQQHEEQRWLELVKQFPAEPAYYDTSEVKRAMAHVIPVLKGDLERLWMARQQASGIVPVPCSSSLYHTRWSFMAPGDADKWIEKIEQLLSSAEALLESTEHLDHDLINTRMSRNDAA